MTFYQRIILIEERDIFGWRGSECNVEEDLFVALEIWNHIYRKKVNTPLENFIPPFIMFNRLANQWWVAWRQALAIMFCECDGFNKKNVSYRLWYLNLEPKLEEVNGWTYKVQPSWSTHIAEANGEWPDWSHFQFYLFV